MPNPSLTINIRRHMWKDKIILKIDEELKHESSKTKGFMGEEDIDLYLVVRNDGTQTGTVTVSDHTAIKGFRRTIWVVQKDAAGRVLVDEKFKPG